MPVQQLAVLILRCIGVYALVNTIALLAFFMSALDMYRHGDDSLTLVMGTLVPFILIAASGCVLILFSENISRRFFRSEKIIFQNATIAALHTALFSATGLIIMLLAIPKLYKIFFMIALDENITRHGLQRSQEDESYSIIFRAAAQFTIGMAVFLWSRSLSDLWLYLQRILPGRKNA